MREEGEVEGRGGEGGAGDEGGEGGHLVVGGGS